MRSHENFYPRPPRGGRPSITRRASAICGFLSTPSARRATRSGHRSSAPLLFLSTPSARRATHFSGHRQGTGEISIHALREEGDRYDFEHQTRWSNFYPRPPRGGRPTMPPSFGSMERISIHALREEGDWPMALMPARALHFYPRPPRGGRRISVSARVLS